MNYPNSFILQRRPHPETPLTPCRGNLFLREVCEPPDLRSGAERENSQVNTGYWNQGEVSNQHPDTQSLEEACVPLEIGHKSSTNPAQPRDKYISHNHLVPFHSSSTRHVGNLLLKVES